MEAIKAIVYGVGAMGRIMTKLMVEKGVVIVGAVGHVSNVGRDLGEVAGLGYPLNVKIRNDADAVLSEQKADIAIVAVATEIEEMYPHLKKCLENRLNVITIADESTYPWAFSPEVTAKLDKLAREHGVTLSGTGYQDGFMVNLLSVLTGASHTIESITGKFKFNVDDYGPEFADYYLVGRTREEFDTWLKEEGFPLNVLIGHLACPIADLGLTVKKIEQRAEPVIADVDIEARSLGKLVKKGQVIGRVEIVEIETEQGIKLQGEMTVKVYQPDELSRGDVTEWHIKGVPELHIDFGKVPTRMVACIQAVNRIPDVINAEAGYIPVNKLPKLKYRDYPLHFYLNR